MSILRNETAGYETYLLPLEFPAFAVVLAELDPCIGFEPSAAAAFAASASIAYTPARPFAVEPALRPFSN